MDILLFVLLIGIFIYVGINNFSLIRRYKHNKKYIACYQDIFHNRENCIENLDSYLELEKSKEYKNKGLIIKLYYKLSNGLEYIDTIKSIDYKQIFYKKNSIDDNLLKYNSDSFVFSMLCLAKAFEKKYLDAIELLVDKLGECKELENVLEYQEIVAIAGIFTKKKNNDTKILHNILDGLYTEYSYDKNMIALYKRIAAATLIFNMEEVDVYFKKDLYSFAKTFIGECYLKCLSIFDIYNSIDYSTDIEDNEE